MLTNALMYLVREAKKVSFFLSRRKKRQREFVQFLEKLLKRWGKVLLFIDGARAHRGKRVLDFLTKHKRTFKLEFFPKYTPELNPTEQCWKPARKKLANRLIKSLPAAQYHLRKVFQDENSMPKMFEYL